MSTLENLFRYAKMSKANARENFTTEAFAGCIRGDPAPFLTCLTGAGLWASSLHLETVETQLTVLGVGYIDLVLVGTEDSGRRLQLWCELKVDAGPSGNQIDRYRAYIASVATESATPIELCSIGRSPLPLDDRVPHLSWHRIARFVRTGDSPVWDDFLDYMAENAMTDTYDDPATAAEIASASEFDGLVGKVARMVELTFEEANGRMTGSIEWPAGEIRKELVGRFAAKGNLLAAAYVPGPRTTSWVVLGIVPNLGSAQLTVWAETWPSQSDLQRRMHDLGDGKLDDSWERRAGPWGGLRTSTQWMPEQSHETSVRWLVERLEELADSGILQAMKEASAAAPPTGEIDDLAEERGDAAELPDTASAEPVYRGGQWSMSELDRGADVE